MFAHVCDCVGSPAQGFPPWEGAGLLQLRDLTSFPPPHDAEHWDHDDQSPQFPSTGHIISKHCCISYGLPTQSFPPCDGAGFVHIRARVFIPLPQVLEHGDQRIQSDQ